MPRARNTRIDQTQKDIIASRRLSVKAEVQVKDTVAAAVNPSHYKTHMIIGEQSFQWLESMQFQGKFKNPEAFKAAVELQIRKYLDRNGGKDSELQELSKALWYTKFLVAFVKNGNKPISIENIDKILAE